MERFEKERKSGREKGASGGEGDENIVLTGSGEFGLGSLRTDLIETVILHHVRCELNTRVQVRLQSLELDVTIIMTNNKVNYSTLFTTSRVEIQKLDNNTFVFCTASAE